MNLPLCTHRYFLVVSYIGTRYNGSQRLVKREASGKQDTIQEALEVALESVFNKKRCVLTAGSRTDKGVHALMACYSLPLMDFSVQTDKLKRMVNYQLIKNRHDIIVNEALLVPHDLHPRRSVVEREYIYRIGVPKRKIGNRPYQSMDLFQAFPAHELYRILPIPYLDMDKFEEAASLFRGVHDFKSFSFRPGETEETVRDMAIDIMPANDTSFVLGRTSLVDIYHVHFRSRAFLHNQIRRIVGAMLSYASYGSAKLSDLRYLLDNPGFYWDPKIAIAEPWGLYLSRLFYHKSSFQGSIRTYEDSEGQEEVDLSLIPAIIDDPPGKTAESCTTTQVNV